MAKRRGWFQSFLRGMGSFSLFGSPPDPETMRILEQTDTQAIAGDWQVVGDDLRKAMKYLKPPTPSSAHEES